MPNIERTSRNEMALVKAAGRYPHDRARPLEETLKMVRRYGLSGLSAFLEAESPEVRNAARNMSETLKAATDPIANPKIELSENLSFGPMRRADFMRTRGPQSTYEKN